MRVLFVEKVLERGERIELLVDRTENLNQAAFKFKKQSTQLKRAMWWKNAKIMIILVFVIVVCVKLWNPVACLTYPQVIVYFIVAMACGGLAFQSCVKTAKKLASTGSTTTSTSTTSTSTGTSTTG